MRSSRQNRRSSCCSRLCTSVYPMDNYLSFAINCRLSDDADGLPADEWRRARAGEHCVGRWCVCTQWKCGGQKNRCSER
ncbi:hypothetical protein PBY51_021259 [Eleginops maclovinus]|uniref:Uncharacterized protein n=1 Tax=Eleginops maclovinus TaxID=56733 RepID=A0AAN7X8R5_ELEMC|nr:hypothetical protein PBY51_021259 [Eleginops maclovinus]